MMKLLNYSSVAICSAIFLTIFHSVAPLYHKSFSEEDLIVEAGVLGKIKGVNTTTIGSNRRAYIRFLGMRYAEPPTGSRRFVPSVRSAGRLNATGEIYYASAAGPACSQPNIYAVPIVQSEDCLTINVYTPKPYTGNDDDLLPVIFFIHGGAFTNGEGNLYNGNRLLSRDVVLVSFNYRLGLLGFFSLNNEDVPGNAGLYDIINALRWTNDFIKYFGGNPNKITIAGQSAGSVAVTHLLTIPAANGLFQGAIAASGTALAAWGTTEDSFNESLRVSQLSGCYNPEGGYPNETMITSIASCMRNTSSDILVKAIHDFQVEERNQGRLGFAAVSPTLQLFNTSSNFPKILMEHPRNVFESGRQANVPLMIGATRHDGSYVLGVYYNRFLKDNNYVNETHSDPEFMSYQAVPRVLQALGIPNEYGVYNTIAKMFLGDARLSGNFSEMYPGLMDLFSVFFFKASSYQTALYHSAINNNTYLYSFDYQGSQTLFRAMFGLEPVPFEGGITHGDDLMYLFQLTFPQWNDEERAVSNRILDYWADFATYGNPTPNISSNEIWRPLTAAKADFLSIGNESIVLQHYDDTWNDVGWELVPTEPPETSPTPTPTTPTTTPTTTTPTTPTTAPTTPTTKSSSPSSPTTPSAENFGMVNVSSKYLIGLMLYAFMQCLHFLKLTL